ncbi:unnamed protein product [Urochloa decumbens]|uniref:F-box domain-containing protein n=1 Tax=Urochloa decumbens TaxID=240449 RepID=A0ABC9BHR4_9POAL
MEPSPPAVAAEAADLLSSLPGHLLDGILGRLDIRDAVRTSALSRAWRHRWESLPELALSFPDGTPPAAVDRVLLRYTGPGVPRFSFAVDPASASHVGHWLVALSRRRVESISIYKRRERPPRPWPTLHSYIFSCVHLVSLNLEFFIIPSFPVGFAGFPVLEELYLGNVEFTYNGERQLQDIIRGSPLLRVLYLADVDNPAYCVIEAPNLHSLTLISDYDEEWRFGELPCLQHASIFVPELEDHGNDFGKFLARFAQVRELAFHSPANEVKIGTTPFTFYNLKSLELSTHFFDMHILLMFSLLRSSPNLEKLKIEVRDWEVEDTEWEFLSAQWTDGMCANLQVVQIISCEQWLPIYFMKLILSKASCLRMLSVDECPTSEDDPLNELLICKKASPQAQILFEVQLEEIRFDRMKMKCADSSKKRA